MLLDTHARDRLWKAVLGELQLMVTVATYNTAFVPLKLESAESGLVTIGCPSMFWQLQMETKYYTLLKHVLEKHLGETVSLIFQVKTVTPQAENVTTAGLPLFATTPAPTATVEQAVPFGMAKQALPEMVLKRVRILPYYTFENFAVGSTNQMAFAAAEAVARTPGTAYNPLFLWGGVGVGKTHLMQAIAHELLGRNERLKAICCPGEEFTNEIVEAIRSKTTGAFKEKYRNLDLLMLDDVQFLAGKDAAQEEFFHTFNAIQRAGGQIVLTSDRPPGEIAKLEDRLRSRFEAGLIVDISKPDFELRTAIILIKATQQGLDIPMDAAQVIASKFESAREMEGFLKNLRLKMVNRETLDADFVREVMGMQAVDTRMRVGIRATDVLKATADAFGVKVSELKGTRRQARIVLPRQVSMYLMFAELGLTYEGIGDVFGKDHTTVMHGVEKVRGMVGKSSELHEQIMRIKTDLR